jgi:hypothetical protein
LVDALALTENWFRFKPEKGYRTPDNLRTVWYRLTPEQRARVQETLLKAGLHPETGKLDFTGEHALTSRDHWNWKLSETAGNWLKAADDIWLQSGSIFGQERMFGDILKKAGLREFTFDSPSVERPGVFPVYLNIRNPLDTGNIPPEVLSRLEGVAKRDRSRAREHGADFWDKTTITPREWFQTLQEGIPKGETLAWTRIPEKITKALQDMGYDGVLDTGGKLGGGEHRVWIAFEPTQIKSAIANVGTFDPTRADIRYATERAPEPERPLGRPKPPGFRRRVDVRVDNYEDALAQQKALGIPTKALSLSREHRQNWDALDPEVKRIIIEWDDVKWLKTLGYRQDAEGNWEKTDRGRALTAPEVMAMDAVVRGRKEAKELTRDAWKSARGGENEAQAWRDYAEALAEYLPLERANINDGTGTARALAARRRLMEAAQTPDRQFLRRVMRDLGAQGKDADLLVRMFETGDPRLGDALRAQMAGRWKQWQTLLRAGLITPSSEIPNLLGNTLVQGMEWTDRAFAAGIDWAASRLHGTQRERYIGEVGAEVGAMLDATPKAFAEFLRDRFGGIYKRAWSGEIGGNLDLNRRLEYQVSPFKSKALRLFSTSLDALAAGDRLFRAPIAAGELAMRSYRQAAKELRQARGPEVEARALEIAQDVLQRPQKYAKLINDIKANTSRRLFQEKPWNFVDKYLRNMERDYPWLTTVLPFVSTPANITRYAIHHSPMGMGTPEFWRAVRVLASGKPVKGMTQGQAADVVSKRVTGTLIFGGAMAAAAMGKVTGSGPADPRERKAKMETGWRPYSWVFEIDGEKVYLPITRFDPASQVIGVAADIVEFGDVRDGKDLATKAIGSIVENYSDRTYMRGMTDFFEAAADPMRFAANYAIGLATMQPIFPRQLARIAQAIDPVIRDVRPLDRSLTGMPARLVNTIMRNYPGTSFLLPARRGPTGEEIIRPGGMGPAGMAMRAFFPIQVSPERPGRELEAEMAKVGEVPGEPRPYMTVQGQQVLRNREHMDLLAQADRGAAHELRMMIRSPLWEMLPDTIEEGGSKSKEGYIRNTFNRHRDMARNMIFRSWSFQQEAHKKLAERRS